MEVFEPLYYLLGALAFTSVDFLIRFQYTSDEQALFSDFNDQQDLVQAVAKKYDIASWVAINQITYLPIQDWLGRDPWMETHGLDDLIKKAIAWEVEEVVRARERAAREQEKKLDMIRAENQSKLQFPRDPGSSIARFLT